MSLCGRLFRWHCAAVHRTEPPVPAAYKPEAFLCKIPAPLPQRRNDRPCTLPRFRRHRSRRALRQQRAERRGRSARYTDCDRRPQRGLLLSLCAAVGHPAGLGARPILHPRGRQSDRRRERILDREQRIRRAADQRRQRKLHRRQLRARQQLFSGQPDHGRRCAAVAHPLPRHDRLGQVHRCCRSELRDPRRRSRRQRQSDGKAVRHQRHDAPRARERHHDRDQLDRTRGRDLLPPRERQHGGCEGLYDRSESGAAGLDRELCHAVLDHGGGGGLHQRHRYGHQCRLYCGRRVHGRRLSLGRQHHHERGHADRQPQRRRPRCAGCRRRLHRPGMVRRAYCVHHDTGDLLPRRHRRSVEFRDGTDRDQ